MLAPVLLVVSAYLFIRGHDEPGGGFIAALVAGTALGLGQLAFPGAQPPWLRRVRAGPLLAVGFLLATGAGLGPMLAGYSFLTPVPIPLGPTGWYLSCGLLFDLGVYLLVLGLVLTAVNRLDVPMADLPTADVAGAPPVSPLRARPGRATRRMRRGVSSRRLARRARNEADRLWRRSRRTGPIQGACTLSPRSG
jgi:multisubunit Na+/H+ antiporter MnhB subunit